MMEPDHPVDPILSVDRVTRRFGGVIAVDGVSFGIAAGTVTGLIGPNGPNGSGKSTLFRLIPVRYRPTPAKSDCEARQSPTSRRASETALASAVPSSFRASIRK